MVWTIKNVESDGIWTMVSKCYSCSLSIPDRYDSVSTQQMHALLVQFKTSILDVRWTYFQAPLHVDFRMLQIIIKERYINGPIAQDIQSGDYELSYAYNSRLILSPDKPLRPGSRIIMGVLLESEAGRCPIPDCGSLDLKPAQGGGNQW